MQCETEEAEEVPDFLAPSKHAAVGSSENNYQQLNCV